jgi:alginate O-acetyltransferase complex protein AlgI
LLFNSYPFLFLFLPALLAGALALPKHLKPLLLLASLIFYGSNSLSYLLILIFNTVVVYGLSFQVARRGKAFLAMALSICLAPLFFFKYSSFTLSLLELSNPWSLALPLGISFFSFQQAAYLVDVYRDRKSHTSLNDFLLFIFFFPQLIAGPIVHHQELIPQFPKIGLRWSQLEPAFLYFSIGFFKKVVLADNFGLMATQFYQGIENGLMFHSIEVWTNTLAYTLQIYFDFSGYCDMAMGLALLFGLRLPINFDSPYKSTSLVEFWRRWHITLSHFLKDYVYFPMGGGRVHPLRKSLNLIITMVIGGFWHGAGWTFLFWGTIHGIGLATQHLLKGILTFPRWLSLLFTFLFVHLGWVAFRGQSMKTVLEIYRQLFFLDGLVLPGEFFNHHAPPWITLYGEYHGTPLFHVTIGLLIIFLLKNSHQLVQFLIESQRRWLFALFSSTLFITSIFNSSGLSEFLYYHF